MSNQKEKESTAAYTRSLIEASLDPLVTISPEGKIMDVNEATINVAGISREKLIGTDFSDYFTEPEKARKGYKEVLSKGYVVDYPLTIRHTSGKLTHVLYNASIYKDEKGEVVGVFAAARDITDRKLAEGRLKQQEELINLATNAIIIRNTKDEIIFWNKGSEKLYGWSNKEVLGKETHSFLQTSFPKPLNEIESEFHKTGNWEGEVIHTKKDGSKITVETRWSLQRNDNGEPLAFLQINNDVTIRKQIQEKLNENYKQLEQSNLSLQKEIAEGKERERIITRQTQEILELSTPILRVWDDIVAAPLIGTLDSERTQHFMERLLNSIVETNSQIALIDITGVPTIDTQTAQHLLETISAAKLLGAKIILTGVRPAIAQTLVHLGVDLSEIDTQSSLSSGLQVAFNYLNLKLTKNN